MVKKGKVGAGGTSGSPVVDVDAALSFDEKLRRRLVVEFNNANNLAQTLSSGLAFRENTLDNFLAASQRVATLGAALATLENARATRDLIDILQGQQGTGKATAPAPGGK